MKYIIREDSICLWSEGKVEIINKGEANYNLVVNWIRSNKELGKIKLLTNYFEYFEGEYYHNGEKVCNQLVRRIVSLINQGKIWEPLLNFSKRMKNPTINPKNKVDILDLIYTKEIPISEQGEILLYLRASWRKGVGVFKEGEEERGKLRCGSLKWIKRECRDEGPIFEVLVEPEDIERLEKRYIEVRRYINVERVREEYEGEGSLYKIRRVINEWGEREIIKRVIDERTNYEEALLI